MKNYSDVWINGLTNHKISCVIDHAKNNQHRAAMNHARKASGTPIQEYSPIAQGLLNMDKATQNRINKKFDICFVMARECLAFAKYPALHKLELRHGVDLGQVYKTKDSAKLFSHYIAEGQRQELFKSLSTSCFYSFLMDGSTDKGNVEDELIVILYSIKDTEAEEIGTRDRFLSLQEPKKADADGLIECLGRALRKMGITNIQDKASVLDEPVLIGGGTDGAFVNVCEQNGMMGKIQQVCPWMFWAWWFAHRLELACKDALSSQLFKDIDDMLLTTLLSYSKSPKKSRELSNNIVEDLNEVFEFPKGGN